ncbi:MAG: hypothetical protein CM15mP32_5190 [Flavobacteriaceae bacterium]|nr:MAG: hypothetical protein CM15mP32_5190 [Flavobacteriaceae bacterium]
MTTITNIETFVLKDTLEKSFSFLNGNIQSAVSVLLKLPALMVLTVGEKAMVLLLFWSLELSF